MHPKKTASILVECVIGLLFLSLIIGLTEGQSNFYRALRVHQQRHIHEQQLMAFEQQVMHHFVGCEPKDIYSDEIVFIHPITKQTSHLIFRLPSVCLVSRKGGHFVLLNGLRRVRFERLSKRQFRMVVTFLDGYQNQKICHT
ncbi:hypothetical protein JOC36_001349 [Weissella uvarum]|uniref:hypothetical protein n=1 Tax=Weissella uvarum TaxID=1479233 RepID=UPI0019619A79|nr:hypothetical protein [Weissella uvarum]MBM7617772.1 hypothetical protein [Weissella uvarum]MCM0595849.1 hypothetical protein [Weissella uvarum]